MSWRFGEERCEWEGIAFALVMVPSLGYFVAVFPVPFMVLPKARPWSVLHCLWILVIWVGTMIAWANGYTSALIAGIVTGGTMVAFPVASVAARHREAKSLAAAPGQDPIAPESKGLSARSQSPIEGSAMTESYVSKLEPDFVMIGIGRDKVESNDIASAAKL